MLLLITTLIFCLTTNVFTSPFKLTEDYIENFKKEIDAIKDLTAHYIPIEENFDPEAHNETEALADAEKYDFIIVGAGGSGAVLAGRLSEIPEWKILVLEAGKPETPVTLVPKIGSILQNSPYNWGFRTIPQKHSCLGMINHSCAIAGGKILGGSTSINGMLYTRGNAKDYDLWADQGNDGWCYNDILPYFKKAEDADLEHFDNKYHNRGGPFHIEHPQHLTHLSKDIIAAGKELQFEHVDYNGKEQLGVSLAQINSRHGKRESTAQAYIEPAKIRPNLIVKTESHAIRVVIGEHTKQAQAVLYLHDGKLFAAKANKEIILSAGAINTPQLLMLSGIGPKEQLTKLDIPVIKDLPVGQHLKDHFGFIALDFIYNKTNEEEDKSYDAVVDYLQNGKGPLSSPGIEVLAYTQTHPPSKHPNIELFFVQKKASSKPGLNPFKIEHEIIEKLWSPIDNKQVLNIGVMLTHPKSTGTVTLKDKDPLHHPLIDTNQFSDANNEDLMTMVEGIKKALKFVETKSLKDQVYANTQPISGCEINDWGTDEYWKCAVQHLSTSLRHVSGTAKMGPESDKESVVNNKLQVHGIEKLRVIDNSVIPVTITGHTMAPAIMIGEKGADLIKSDWK